MKRWGPVAAVVVLLCAAAIAVVVHRHNDRVYNHQVALCTGALMDRGIGHDDAVWECIARMDR